MTDHPTLELLEAYRQGTLGPEEAAALQDHLAVCKECVQTLLEMGRFQKMMAAAEPKIPEAGRPSPAETEASWQALRTRLAPRPGASRPVLEASGRFRRWTPSRRSFFSLAAALLACLIGFPLWMSQRPTETPVILVQPGAFEITRGGSDSRPPISVTLADATAVLSLPVPSRAAFTSYRIEILTLRGETLLTVTPSLVPWASRPDAAAPAPESPRIVVFSLLQGALPGGDYRLRLVGLQGAREETLAEHPLRIVS